MSKKVLTGLLIVGLVFVFSGMAMAQNDPVTFNLSATVDPYIETSSTYSIDLGSGIIGTLPTNQVSTYWSVYANCPFKASYSGDNAVGDGVPMLARQQTNSSNWDRLPTALAVNGIVNGGKLGIAPGNTTHTKHVCTQYFSPRSRDFPVPYNGQVQLEVLLGIKWHATYFSSPTTVAEYPKTGGGNTNHPNAAEWESADAGIYTASFVLTFAAL